MNTKRNGAHYFQQRDIGGAGVEYSPPPPPKLMFCVCIDGDCIAQCASIRDAAGVALRHTGNIQLLWKLETDTLILWTRGDADFTTAGALVAYCMIRLNSFLRVRFPGASAAASGNPAAERPTFPFDDDLPF